MRRVVSTLGLATLLAGCGVSSVTADPADPGDDGPVGARVRVGTTLDGGRVPLVEEGEGDRPARAWLVDAATGALEALPPLPDEGSWAAGYTAATEDWTVVVGSFCPEPPVDSDTGPECVDEGRNVVMALGAGEVEWRAVETDPEWTLPFPRSIADDVLTLTAVVPGEEGDRLLTIDLGGPEPTLGPLGELGPDLDDRSCSFGQDPQPVFATDAGPTTAVLPGAGGAPGEEVPLPDLALDSPPWGGVICWASGRFLLVGDPPPEGEFPSGVVTHRLYDLSDAGRPVAEVEVTDDLMDFAAAGDRAVLVGMDDLVVLAATGEEVGRAEIGVDTEVRATDAGVVVVHRREGDDGWLRFASVEVLDL